MGRGVEVASEAKHERKIEAIARGLVCAGEPARVLLCQHVKHGYFYLPGGHIETGETAAQALVREMQEEAGEHVTADALVHVHEHAFEQKGKPRQEVNLTHAARLATTDGRVPNVRSQEDGIAFAWLTVEELLLADLRPAAMRPWLCEALAMHPTLPTLTHDAHDARAERPAVFLDRDGTIIREVHYIARPGQVELLPGAAEAIASLRAAGFACVMVSNQSGVGRGMVSQREMWLVQAEVTRQLATAGTRLDGVYFCPLAPPADADGSADRRSRVDHPDRKPGPGMLLRARAELRLALERSWMVGDMLSDVLAGVNAGCRGTIHVRTGHGASQPEASARASYSAENLAEAARIVLRERGR
jgi:D-glycero-D-manno-heptose 1,7-bisphosphate phosphatase